MFIVLYRFMCHNTKNPEVLSSYSKFILASSPMPH
jgi:hypothetical protein